jgi:hypothetical protein
MFDTQQLISDCQAALGESNAQAAVNEIVQRAIRKPEPIIRALGEPRLAGIDTIYKGPELTILNVLWGP